MISWLESGDPFPPHNQALRDPNGLLAAGGDLSPARLIDAYSHGIFPWFNADEPILWWSPDPRMVLFPAELKVSRSLKKVIRNREYEVRLDSAFSEVMRGCAQARQGQSGTWITPVMIEAYTQLHNMGVAHSAETWVDGKLAGGLYGLALGRMFYGESMFTEVNDASKIAFVHLVWQLKRWGFGMIDCQMKTAHLATFGATEIPRTDFMRRVSNLIQYSPAPISWQFDAHLKDELEADA
jgi:leucyl/phenylalanyl-tRNA--protein transferase